MKTSRSTCSFSQDTLVGNNSDLQSWLEKVEPQDDLRCSARGLLLPMFCVINERASLATFCQANVYLDLRDRPWEIVVVGTWHCSDVHLTLWRDAGVCGGGGVRVGELIPCKDPTCRKAQKHEIDVGTATPAEGRANG